LVKRNKAHIDAESVIDPAVAITFENMIGTDVTEKVSKVQRIQNSRRDIFRHERSTLLAHAEEV